MHVPANAGISREKDSSTDTESMLFNFVYKSYTPRYIPSAI